MQFYNQFVENKMTREVYEKLSTRRLGYNLMQSVVYNECEQERIDAIINGPQFNFLYELGVIILLYLRSLTHRDHNELYCFVRQIIYYFVILFLERKHTLKLYYKPLIFVVVDTVIRHPIRLVSMLLIELILSHVWYAICTAVQKYSSAEQVLQTMSKAIVNVGIYTKVTAIMAY